MLRRFLAGALILLCLLPLGAAENGAEKASGPGPVQLDQSGDVWARNTLKQLSLEQKIGQMLVIWGRAQFLNQQSPQYQRLRDTIRKYHIGTIGFTIPVDAGFPQKAMPYEAAVFTNQLQQSSELPLLFAADFEYGLTMRVEGATPFPYPMAFGAAGDLSSAEQFGYIVAREARAIGVHWNWFPTADANSNPLNPIINTRSFGEDPQAVGVLLSAYIRGAHRGGMLTTAKHFPGHGDTSTDTHIGLATVSGNAARLNAVELAPFRDAISAGVDSVMVAHVTAPALDPDPNRVASTSPAIVNGLLKEKMGFLGLIVTDSLDMAGLMRLYAKSGNPSGEAAVAAVLAGNDMVLLPQDLDGAFRGLVQAVRNGKIKEAQIDASVLKILRAKASVGLHKSRLVNVDQITEAIAQPENLAVGEKVAQQAVTLVRESKGILPVGRTTTSEPSGQIVVVVFTDEVRQQAGRAFVRELRARVPDAQVFYMDPQIAGALTEPVLAAAAKAKTVLVPVYAVPVSGKTVLVGKEMKNTVSLTGESAELLRELLTASASRIAVVAMGNPYLISEYPQIQTYMCTFSNLPVSEVAAVRALFGETPIRGRLPVTLPNIAPRGEGLERPIGSKSSQSRDTASAR